jgi:hypothetical protein
LLVLLRWYCERPKGRLCFRKEEAREVDTDEELEATRAMLFKYPFSTCTCGERIVRSMVIPDAKGR